MIHRVLCIVLLAVMLAVGFTAGRETAPICHSDTEDSQILDCDYRDGGWHP